MKHKEREPSKKWIIYLIVFIPVIFTAIFYFPELIANSPDVNDNTFHIGLAKSVENQIFESNLLDYWIPYWSGGSPVFHEYQFLPSLITALIYRIFNGGLSMQLIMHLLIYLLLVFFPLVIYYSLRKIGFNRYLSAFSALFSLGISVNGSYGWEYGSYIFKGWGMYSQLFGMFFMPLFIARVAVSLKTGKYYGLALIFFMLTLFSHILFGYIGCIICLFLILRETKKSSLFKSIRRLVLMFFIIAVVTSYFWLPLIVDSGFHYRSVYEPIEKFDSYGHQEIITKFISGEFLDFGRFPIMTILCIAGLLFSLYKSLDKKHGGCYRLIFYGFIFWFFLYFGRPTWGKFIDLLPMGNVIHLSRLINGLHFFVILCIGAGMEFIWQRIRIINKLSLKQKFICMLLFVLLISFPVFKERGSYLLNSGDLAKSIGLRFNKEWPDFEKVLDKIKTLPQGRVYCGRMANWGRDYKIGESQCVLLLGAHQIENIGYIMFSWAPINDFQNNFREYELSNYELYNVRYVISDESKEWPDFVKPIFQSGRHILYEIKTSGYFDLVNSDILLQADKNNSWNFNMLWKTSNLLEIKHFMSVKPKSFEQKYDNQIIAKNKYSYTYKTLEINENNEHHIFDDDPLFDKFSFLQKENLGQINNESKNKEVYQAEFTALKDSFLLFKVNYHPNWHILIDGEEKEKIMLSPGMIGVKIEPGEHTVKAFYQPRKIKSVLFFMGLIAFIGLLFKNEKKIF
ncbi:hypothetical protein KKG58_02750 [Patescibacteria group bacterium]|nr:hypothetical protein [Patescibacteria group bacterium]